MNTVVTGQKLFYLIDAKNQIAGRLASKIVPILMGKHKPIYSPHLGQECGDHVVIVNAKHVALTGDKWKRKMYRWHTGYAGGLKEYTAEQRHERFPTYVLETAIKRMLPKSNSTTRKLKMSRVHIFPEDVHTYEAQQPIPLDLLGTDAVYAEKENI
ncbi:predicted protein [Naegleria gruberi]|uniref:Predicted protein n=1 Tax=Naegleria gruberi TaxID=5762 RepID=D2UZL4_NAEGR|nr:uncharacterized protein NAEGRDRAFT_34892 [Naegleria gruberi]EFC50174.1 predicted protein [Naegleria gruberi]|eukprot:XP_002682918.1 predicted protein [Naegleria gruberi strain NEG-M]